MVSVCAAFCRGRSEVFLPDWLVEGGDAIVQNGELALTLTESNGGTRITSSRYVHYGTISATSASLRFMLSKNIPNDVGQ